MSTLLRRGNATMYVYPHVWVTNKRGERLKVPSSTPIAVRFSVAEDRSSDSDIPGQLQVRVVRGLTANFPDLDSWDRIVYDGWEWDLTAPPVRTPGFSRAMRHVEFGMKSRNQTAVNLP